MEFLPPGRHMTSHFPSRIFAVLLTIVVALGLGAGSWLHAVRHRCEPLEPLVASLVQAYRPECAAWEVERLVRKILLALTMTGLTTRLIANDLHWGRSRATQRALVFLIGIFAGGTCALMIALLEGLRQGAVWGIAQSVRGGMREASQRALQVARQKGPNIRKFLEQALFVRDFQGFEHFKYLQFLPFRRKTLQGIPSSDCKTVTSQRLVSFFFRIWRPIAPFN